MRYANIRLDHIIYSNLYLFDLSDFKKHLYWYNMKIQINIAKIYYINIIESNSNGSNQFHINPLIWIPLSV